MPLRDFYEMKCEICHIWLDINDIKNRRCVDHADKTVWKTYYEQEQIRKEENRQNHISELTDLLMDMQGSVAYREQANRLYNIIKSISDAK